MDRLDNAKRPAKRSLPLRWMVLLPFLVQISVAVGLTGYLSIRNGQAAISDMAKKLEQSGSKQVEQHLNSYLTLPPKINQVNINAIEAGDLNLQDLRKVGQSFCSQMQNFDIGYISFANPQGNFIGVERLDDGNLLINEQSANTQGKLDVYATKPNCDRAAKTATKDDYQPLEESWYADAAKVGKPIWSSIYNWDDKPEVISVSASYPIYTNDRKLRGVLSIDLILTQISTFLKGLKVSSGARTFLIERDGFLIATSTDEQPYKLAGGKAQRLKAVDSKDAVIRSATQKLTSQFQKLGAIKGESSLETTIDGQRHFLHVSPWQDNLGLDWLIVVAVPESDFLGQVENNTRQTIILCFLALVGATIVGIFTSRWIVKPIQQLSQASNQLANGDWQTEVPASNIAEINSLARSFSRMKQQIQAQMSGLTQDKQALQEQVADQNQTMTQILRLLQEGQGTGSDQQFELGKMLGTLSKQIKYPVLSMQKELKNANQDIQVILEQLQSYQDNLEKLPPELRDSLADHDVNLLIQDLKKRLSVMDASTARIDDISDNLKSFVQQIDASKSPAQR
jgi:HAMP domain-containing protein